LPGLLELGQHDDRLGRHGAADVHDVVALGQPREVGDRLAHRRLGGAVEDQPHRALLPVLGHEDHRAPEVRVEDRR
jgi:hypothetical protein